MPRSRSVRGTAVVDEFVVLAARRPTRELAHARTDLRRIHSGARTAQSTSFACLIRLASVRAAVVSCDRFVTSGAAAAAAADAPLCAKHQIIRCAEDVIQVTTFSVGAYKQQQQQNVNQREHHARAVTRFSLLFHPSTHVLKACDGFPVVLSCSACDVVKAAVPCSKL